jgi:hypothetical protein
MEETTTVSPTFQKGFNQGYQMQQHKPEMSEKLLESADMEQEYWQGFEGGAKEYSNEISNDKGKDSPSIDRSPDMD